VSREQLAAWREQTTANFILRMFNGNHFFIHQAVPLLTNTFSYELSQLVGEST
jgi:medium-chain acyl-[acyl-carrier-protein] hydrolase